MPTLEQKQKIKLAAAAVTLLIALAGIFAYFVGGKPPSALGLTVTLKCADPNCGEVLRTSRADVDQHTTKDTLQPDAPGLLCPKCQKNTQAAANVCPKDGSVFYVRSQNVKMVDGEAVSTAGEMVCPTCKWNPTEDQRKKMAELNTRK